MPKRLGFSLPNQIFAVHLTWIISDEPKRDGSERGHADGVLAHGAEQVAAQQAPLAVRGRQRLPGAALWRRPRPLAVPGDAAAAAAHHPEAVPV